MVLYFRSLDDKKFLLGELDFPLTVTKDNTTNEPGVNGLSVPFTFDEFKDSICDLLVERLEEVIPPCDECQLKQQTATP